MPDTAVHIVKPKQLAPQENQYSFRQIDRTQLSHLTKNPSYDLLMEKNVRFFVEIRVLSICRKLW